MRTLFRRRAGQRAVRGGHIITLQSALAKVTAAPPTVDGVFGQQTETALRLWQAGNGLQQTGMVDELTWRGVTSRDVPSVFQRCLALTAAFEEHGYTFAAGNWDGAYVTWGIVGFTLKHGNFGRVISLVEARHPGLIQGVMGSAKAQELLAVIDAPAAAKRAWGESISLLPKKYRLRPDWQDAFDDLGHRPQVRAIQDEVAFSVYWKKAMNDLGAHGKLTELDAALFFDTAVQNGGVDAAKASAIQNALAANPGASGRQRLALIAEAIAVNSNPKFQNDVRSRRRAISDGTGVVHGASYQAEDWGLDDLGVTAAELQTA